MLLYNTLKFIESFKVISLFSYQGSLFCCRSRQQLVYYILSSLFCQELFSFFEKFSFNRFCPICYLKRDNFDILSCVVLFVKIFFVLFWKSFQNHVVLCQIMSYPAVSLTIIPLVFYSVNHFLILFSLASEQQRLNFTLLWHLVLQKSWFSKWNSFFNPQHTSFFFCLLRLYAFSASIRHFWCQIGQVLHKWLIYVLTAFNQPHRKRY